VLVLGGYELKTILVLGGYGNFGKRIVADLANIKNIKILICGRSLAKAQALVEQLEHRCVATLQACVMDHLSVEFADKMKQVSPDVVIHTGGPFQGQKYTVLTVCAQIGSHCIDLADDRQFVCGVNVLDDKAKENDVLLVSGASSVPGLSSAVVEHYQSQFCIINSLDIAIAPGNKAPRGEATVAGILSYTGRPFKVYRQGNWHKVFGWMDARKVDFSGIVGKRWLANVDVPDLTLFPTRYKVTDSVTFQAGLELPLLHLSMVGMAFLAKKGLVGNWSNLTKPIVQASNLFLPFGTDNGAMRVVISGVDLEGRPRIVKWTLFAPNGVGPNIPILSAIIVAKKLLLGDSLADKRGAMACIDLFKLADFLPYFEQLGIYCEEQVK
jgi:saccharopine dehydrogenase-like NADP-dependent oxidoreductase